MSFDATKWVRAQAFTDPLHRYLALEIADYADTHGIACVSIKALAEITLLSRRAVIRKLAEMEELDFLHRIKRRRMNGHQAISVTLLSIGEHTDVQQIHQ
jgi:hypothetical protein